MAKNNIFIILNMKRKQSQKVLLILAMVPFTLYMKVTSEGNNFHCCCYYY